MPGLGGYVNRRLPRHLWDTSSKWYRDQSGDIADQSQYTRKLRGRGKYGRDPKTSQWDWLYGGTQRPTKGHYGPYGYSVAPGTRFNPAEGTLGGRREVLGIRDIKGEWWNDPALGGANPMSGGLGQYRYNVASDLFRPPNLYGRAGGAVPADTGGGGGGGGKGGPASMAAGWISGILGRSTDPSDYRRLEIGEGREQFDEGDTSPYRRDIYISNPLGRDAAGPIGQPQTPMAQAIQLAMEEATLGNFGQFRALTNLGIFGPAGMQSILEQAEGPENMMLADLPGRIEGQINQNAIRGADARRQMLKGASLGRAGAQRPGMGAQRVAEMTIPQRMEESRYASGITEAGYNMADQISLGQGYRRSDLSKENMQSKLLGLQGTAAATGQAQGMLGERYWDPQSPYDMGLEASSRLAELQGSIGRRAASQQQGYRMYNDRMASFYRQVEMKYGAEIALALESQMKDMGLGQYYDDEGFWDYMSKGLSLYVGGPFRGMG